MRPRANLYRRCLVAKIIRLAIIGECIAFPILGLVHAARSPEKTQTQETLIAFNNPPPWRDSVFVRSLKGAAKSALMEPAPLPPFAPPSLNSPAISPVSSTAAASMDPLSRQLFGSRDVQFKYVQGQEAPCHAFEIFLFGKPLSKLDYTELVAAPSGAKIRVRTSVLIPRLIILVDHPLYKGTQVRSLFKYGGKIFMENNGWIVRDDAPSGVATRVVGRQVYMAHRIGVREIGVYAAGSYDDPHFNGYYTWPRLGFNVPLAKYKEPLEADGFLDVVDTNDLFSRPGGPEWWKRNGKDCYGSFDLDPQSASSIVLRHYLKAKGAVPYEGAD